MKILQIIDSLPGTSGGARFVVNLSKSLKDKGEDVSVLLIDGSDSHFLQELINHEIPLIILEKNTNSRFKPKFIKEIAFHCQNFEVVHVHIFPTSYLVGLANFFYTIKAPIIFTEHNSFNKRAGNTVFRYFENFIYNQFTHVVALSDQVKLFIIKNLNVKDSKITIIENAVDIDRILKSTPTDRASLSLDDDDFLLLMSARLSAQKNHIVLLKALVDLPKKVKLLLAGDGVLRDELKRKCVELGIEERVYFLGNRNDIYELMKMTDVNILSSNFEGLSLAALESMSSGKPFIASNVEGLDFVLDNKELLFDNKKTEIVDLINNLKNNKDFYIKAQKYCLERVKDFDYNVMTNKYIQVYKNSL